MSLYEPPTNEIIAGVLLLVASLSLGRGARRLVRGLREADPLAVVRGLRGWVIALALGTGALGVLSAQGGFVTLGGIFLAEELYQTGILAVIIRSGERVGTTRSPGLPAPAATVGSSTRGLSRS